MFPDWKCPVRVLINVWKRPCVEDSIEKYKNVWAKRESLNEYLGGKNHKMFLKSYKNSNQMTQMKVDLK